MRVTKSTPTVLKLQEKIETKIILEAFALVLFFGLPFFLMGLMAVLSFGKLNTLNCNRIEPSQVTCELTSESLISKSISKIDRLQGTEIQEKRDSDGDTYRIIVLTSESRRLSLPRSYNSNNTISKIDAFLNNREQLSLRIQRDNRSSQYILGSIFMLFGGGFILLILQLKWPTSCLFSKTTSKLSVKYQNILFQSYTIEENLASIAEVEVDGDTDEDGIKSYTTNLVLRSGKSISLGSSKSNFASVKIKHFLGLLYD